MENFARTSENKSNAFTVHPTSGSSITGIGFDPGCACAASGWDVSASDAHTAMTRCAARVAASERDWRGRDADADDGGVARAGDAAAAATAMVRVML